MINLSNLLERFSQSLNKDSFTKGAVIDVISTNTKVSLSPESISLKDGVLEISASPVVKNEISLKEESIRVELKERYKISFSRILYK